MKLISLNTWGGGAGRDELLGFFERNKDVDIFCLQEILKGGIGQTERREMKGGYEEIDNILVDHVGYFSGYGDGGYFGESSKDLDFDYGIACFVKNKREQSFVDSVILQKQEERWGDYSGPFAAGVSSATTVSGYAIVNVHGLWQGSIKIDTEAKLEQSKRIIDLINRMEGRKILCGDFNLRPDTKSIKKFEDVGFRNLIKEYGITSTRTSHYTKPEKFADYILVSDGIDVLDFKVLPDEVSDHSPLYLEFE